MQTVCCPQESNALVSGLQSRRGPRPCCSHGWYTERLSQARPRPGHQTPGSPECSRRPHVGQEAGWLGPHSAGAQGLSHPELCFLDPGCHRLPQTFGNLHLQRALVAASIAQVTGEWRGWSSGHPHPVPHQGGRGGQRIPSLRFPLQLTCKSSLLFPYKGAVRLKVLPLVSKSLSNLGPIGPALGPPWPPK